MFKLTLICLVAAVVEAIQLVVIKKDYFYGKQDPNSQYEHYMMTFPETITLTIHRDTGKYYVPKNERARGGKYLFSLFISLLAGAFIVNMFM